MVVLNAFQADALELELRDEADRLEASLDQYKRGEPQGFIKGQVQALRNAASRVHYHAYEKPAVDRVLAPMVWGEPGVSKGFTGGGKGEE